MSKQQNQDAPRDVPIVLGDKFRPPRPATPQELARQLKRSREAQMGVTEHEDLSK
jgi:hypothetical protein